MPAPRRLIITPSAVRDLDDVIAWYVEQQVPDVGTRLVGEIIASVEGLLEYPEMGRVVPEFGMVNLRELIHPPFRIVYRMDKGTIQMVRIWRSERLMGGETVSQSAPSIATGEVFGILKGAGRGKKVSVEEMDKHLAKSMRSKKGKP